MKRLITTLILIVILYVSGCAPNSVGLGAMVIDLDSKAGDIRGVAPIVMLNWNIEK